ncbi:DUF1810 domain-containing protein [Pseudomonas sp. DC3200b2]|uniref:DUF1810 domain-containing protein n=1 Tax=Pseudomonas sp. DC3200b2 TaxID=2804669 RepID=UPI003CE85B70
MTAHYDLQRFLDAQAPVYARVVEELRAGQKRSHWMWFVFPQLQGLGRSETARYYAISSVDEAVAYLAHPELGPRLRQCCQMLLQLQSRSPAEIFGELDALKLHSSITLFLRASSNDPLLQDVLDRFYSGEQDPRTLELLSS